MSTIEGFHCMYRLFVLVKYQCVMQGTSPPPPPPPPGLTIGQRDRSIYSTVGSALTYLDARTEFWRQQKPMYARKREKELKKWRPSPTKPKSMEYPFIRYSSRLVQVSVQFIGVGKTRHMNKIV